MSLPAFTNNPDQTTPCKTERESWSCKNMQPKENDTSMEYEYYNCLVCGRYYKLDYDEMR